MEMLIFGPKSKLNPETIKECVGRRINLFRCGHIQQLYEEACKVRSRLPGSAPESNDDLDKSVQDAADKDNYKSAYARAVKPQLIATITSGNRSIVTSKYPKRLHLGYSQAADFLASHDPHSAQFAPRELPGDVINSIRGQNKGRGESQWSFHGLSGRFHSPREQELW